MASREARAAALAVALVAGCRGAAPPPGPGPDPAPSLLLVTIDTLRRDHVSIYDPAAAPRTEHLDGLARRGVRFDWCFAPAPLTLPSHTSLLSGLDPPRHGVRDNGSFVAPASLTTLAERLRDRGFATAAFVGSFVLDARFGLDQGFDTYRGPVAGAPATNVFPGRPAGEVTAEALDWLASRRPARFFLWVHYFDPHAPYEPPEPWRSRYPRSPYAGEVAYADAELGRLLQGLEADGRLAHTVVAVTSDHGESLGEHGEETHGYFTYNATLRVPLVLWWPGVSSPGLSVSTPVGLVDVYPTLLELLGEPADEVDGESLLGLLGPDPPPRKRAIYFESLYPELHFAWGRLEGLVEPPWKLVEAPRPELYRVPEDPGEIDDRSGAEPETLGRLRELLARRVAGTARAPGPEPTEPPPEVSEALRALGYLTASAPAPVPGEPRCDPKDRLPAYRSFLDAQALIGTPGNAEAIPLLRAFLAQEPRSLGGHYNLGLALQLAGQREAAAAAYRAALALDARRADLWNNLGTLLLEQSRWDEAEQVLAEGLRQAPRSPPLLHNLGVCARERGDVARARGWFERALEADPRGGRTLAALARLEAAERPERAAELLERALVGKPGHAELWRELASLYDRLGQTERATRARLIAAEPPAPRDP